MKIITTFILCLMTMNAMAQNYAKTNTFKISKGNKLVDITEIQNGLLVDNYKQLLRLITKHNKVNLSQEFVKKETDFLKDSIYYFVQIQTHCNQPELHNIIPKINGDNTIEIHCISVFSEPICPGVSYPETYFLSIPKKYKINKEVVVTIKYDEVIEHQNQEIINKNILGRWIEGEYNDSLKIVEPLETSVNKEIFEFGIRAMVTKREKSDPEIWIWTGLFDNDTENLTIEYLSFVTSKGIGKETNKKESYKIVKLTDNELVIIRNGIDGKAIPQAYLKQK